MTKLQFLQGVLCGWFAAIAALNVLMGNWLDVVACAGVCAVFALLAFAGNRP